MKRLVGRLQTTCKAMLGLPSNPSKQTIHRMREGANPKFQS